MSETRLEDTLFEGSEDAFSAAASGRGSFSYAAGEFLPDLRTKAWQPLEWTSRHDMIVILTIYGKSVEQVAEELDFTPQYVSLILTDPRAILVKKKLSQGITDALRDVNDRLKALSSEAVTELADEMRNCENVKIRQTAAFGILDRAGYSPLKRVSNVETPQLPSNLADRIESALDEQETVEADYEIVAPDPEAWEGHGGG